MGKWSTKEPFFFGVISTVPHSPQWKARHWSGMKIINY
jgi:hypothetical protein